MQDKCTNQKKEEPKYIYLLLIMANFASCDITFCAWEAFLHKPLSNGPQKAQKAVIPVFKWNQLWWNYLKSLNRCYRDWKKRKPSGPIPISSENSFDDIKY